MRSLHRWSMPVTVIACLTSLNGTKASALCGLPADSPARAKMSFSNLMTGADLIVVGTADLGPMKPSDEAKLRDAPNTPGTVIQLEGWECIKIRGEWLSGIMTIRIERILASPWNEKELRKRVVTKEGGKRSLFVVLHMNSTVFMDAMLLPRNLHVLWLKEYKMPDMEARKLGVEPSACYTVVDGWKGAVCLSDSDEVNKRLSGALGNDRRLTEHFRKTDFLVVQKMLLKNTFGAEDAGHPLKAADTFAEALMEGAPTERMLRDLARKGDGVYSLTARELLKKKNVRRFRFREPERAEPDSLKASPGIVPTGIPLTPTSASSPRTSRREAEGVRARRRRSAKLEIPSES